MSRAIVKEVYYHLHCDFCSYTDKIFSRGICVLSNTDVRKQAKDIGWHRVKGPWVKPYDIPMTADICPPCWSEKRHLKYKAGRNGAGDENRHGDE